MAAAAMAAAAELFAVFFCFYCQPQQFPFCA
jgi:hypothetical protein